MSSRDWCSRHRGAERPAEYAALVQDVYERAVQVPLEVHNGLVLDGRHRLRAAHDAGLDSVPVIDVAPPENDPDGTAYMLKAALLRRHLSDDQRALMAARWAKAHPLPRGGDRKSAKARALKQAQVGKVDPTPGRSSAASTFGVAPSRVKKAASLLAAAPELAAKVEAGEIKIGQALGSLKRKEQLAGAERATLPAGTFRTIVADPPWRYQDAGCRGAAAGHYPTMSLEKICALAIREHAAQDAHCYLWVTNPMLVEGFKVLAAWGFEFKTMLTWKKPRLGLGRYYRSQTEHVLFGVRGKLPLHAQDISNFFEAPQGRHSEKPEEFSALVERASPGPYLELFARKQRPGWTCWGAEVEAPVNDGSTGIIGSTPEVKPKGTDS